MKQYIIDAIQRIPILQDVSPDEIDIERMGGLNNETFHVTVHDQDYSLRIPGDAEANVINRIVEKHNNEVAVSIGISPELLFFSDCGLSLTRFISDCETLNREIVNSDECVPSHIGATIRQLHDCGKKFKHKFRTFKLLNGFLSQLDRKAKEKLPDGYFDCIDHGISIQKVLDDNPVEFVPCHCDTIPENFLVGSDRTWMIDWEYSRMNDPYFDLATFVLSSHLPHEQEIEVLTGYLGRDPSFADYARMAIYKAFIDILWTPWGIINNELGNDRVDYSYYTVERFGRCSELMSSEEFSCYVKTVQMH